MRAVVVASILGMLFVGGCALRPPPAPTEPARCLDLPKATGPEVARVGRTALTTERLLTRIEDQGSSAIKRYSDPEALRDFVEDQIRFELLAYAAIERDLHRHPDVIEAARKVMVRKLLESDLTSEELGGAPGEKALKRYYDRNQSYYVQPAMRRIAHIQLAPTEDGRVLGEKLAESLRVRPEDQRFFRQLVLRHSLDAETRARGGELLFKSEAELVDDFGLSFAQDVFEAESAGLLPSVVQSTRGWHIVRMQSRRDELVRPFEEVRTEIEEKLLAGRRAKAFDVYLNALRERHPVVFHPHRLPELASRLRVEAEEYR